MSSSSYIAFAVIFAVGLLLLGISSAMLRSLREETPRAKTLSWTQLIDESLTDPDAQLRLDMIERLGILNSDWSRTILERARSEDPDDAVRSAVELALKR